MTASAAERGYGATLSKTGNCSGQAFYPVFTGIVEISDYSDIGVSRSDIDITSHDSDSSSNEFIPGLLEAAELTVTGNFISTDASGQVWAISDDFYDGSMNQYTLTMPNTAASTFVFYAYVKSYKFKEDLKGAIKVTIVFKISGAPTFTV